MLTTAREAPVATALSVCLALAIISVIVLPWVPSSDPYAWIDWGQEIASRTIPFSLTAGPSWKPFPVIFTTIFGLFGSAGPYMWLAIVRLAGLAALVAAYRLGRRFAGSLAGVLAALALCVISSSAFYFARGASEPIVAALTLWAIERHLAGAPRAAFLLLAAAALNRPEFSPFVIAYAAYLWLRVPGSRPLAVAGLATIPIAWLAPPLIVSGNALQASNHALAGKGSPGSAIAELRSSPGQMTAGVLILAAIGLAFAWVRRERALLWLAAGALAWALMVALMTQVAYGLPRYLLPAVTVGCLLAGVAVARLAELAAARGGWPAAYPIVALALAATLPSTIPRIGQIAQQVRDAQQSATVQRELFEAVDRAGGARTVLPCRSSYVAVNHTVGSMLAWKLRVPLRHIKPAMRRTGYVFIAPHLRVTGAPPAIAFPERRTIHSVASAGIWRVEEVTLRNAPTTPRCGA